MTYQTRTGTGDQKTLPGVPVWVTSGPAETLETVAFRSGAVVTVLDQLIRDPGHGVPLKLLGGHLALMAATATSKLEGRLARAGDIRDAYHLTPPGEARGPDGDLLAFWRDAVRMPRGQSGLADLVGAAAADYLDDWMTQAHRHAQTHGPLAGCTGVMQAVLEADDRAERVACLLSDAVLARALKWPVILPVSAQAVTKPLLRDLAMQGQGADLGVQQRLLAALEDVIGLARQLADRAAALRAVAPKLRAKGSEAAVALFLTEVAVGPSTMLSPVIQGSSVAMTDRAARRFCDRLVDLGVARELTGRATFRLYGIAP